MPLSRRSLLAASVAAGTTSLADRAAAQAAGALLEVGPALTIPRAAIPAGVDLIQTSGFASGGDRGQALYRRLTPNTQPAHAGWVRDAGGQYFELIPDARGANVRAFGALGTGGTPQGDTQGHQGALDYAAYFHHCRVYAPADTYTLTDSLHVGGYGDGGRFNSCVLEGDFPRYRAEDFGGTAWVFTRTDRPGFIFQGGRQSRVLNGAIIGALRSYIEHAGLGASTAPPARNGRPVDDLDPAAWVDPAIAAAVPGVLGRYSPHAAIAVDPRSGPRPPGGYPDVVYPAFLGSQGQYDKPYSSDCLAIDCYFAGWAVVCAIQPGDADGNGDFCGVERAMAEYCVYGLSVGNSQARNTVYRNIKHSRVHTLITNNTHGRRSGCLQGGDYQGLSLADGIQIIDGDPGWAGTFSLPGLYAEGLWRIGAWPTNNATSMPIKFGPGAHFAFEGQTDYRGYPAAVLAGSGVSPVAFDTAHFTGFAGVLLFSGAVEGYAFQNCSVRPLGPGAVEAAQLRAAPHQRLAHNSLAGGFAFVPLPGAANRPSVFEVKTGDWFDIDTGERRPAMIRPGMVSDRAHPLCAWIDAVAPRDAPTDRLSTPALFAAVADKSALAITRSGLEVTIAGLRDWVPDIQGGLPGDSLYDDHGQFWLWIHTHQAGVIHATIMNGHRAGEVAGHSPTQGNLYFLNARVFTPRRPLFADAHRGSRTLTDVASDDGMAAGAEVQGGDALWPPDRALDDWIDLPSAVVAAASPAARTVTLAGAATRDGRRRLTFLARGAGTT